ncbi:tannase/feruloyl esterase family alpha/beta hydrolase [Rhodopseudomonas sp. P2A-2r]|uniref:tannase/feruloyl esterase family alpha/beta hydrolase n=1 Tax=unclassified Rhodopseudomonas TaxID=2638247 RepID=UPI0022348EA8|nr:tannase/feruloyl esterase family alpha/beta hydrolase [Rhodopseudomonas sp. P2A-2r]UZE49004.1 tannase/feruloyl esterase family alpha/beta hydrolase [Rhodopseudomonas sp. P2A-2r]
MQRFDRTFSTSRILLLLLSAANIVTAATSASAQNANDRIACDHLKSVDIGGDTTVILTREFRTGDPIALDEAQKLSAPKAQKDVCLVKLIIGPGRPGPADAPSSSAGISLNVWLPAATNWNKRYMAYGQGGYAGSADFKSVTALNVRVLTAVAAAQTGYVTSNSDDGHAYGGSAHIGSPKNLNGAASWKFAVASPEKVRDC